MSNDAEIFKGLWGQVSDCGVNVVYWTSHCPEEDGLAGSYNPNLGADGQKRPLIVLYRSPRVPRDQHAPDLEKCPLEDSVTLAHEFGHFLSDRDGNHTDEYIAAVTAFDYGNGSLYPASHRELIIMEEERAWDNARHVLEGLGFDAWEQFDERRARSLSTYGEKLTTVYAT